MRHARRLSHVRAQSRVNKQPCALVHSSSSRPRRPLRSPRGDARAVGHSHVRARLAREAVGRRRQGREHRLRRRRPGRLDARERAPPRRRGHDGHLRRRRSPTAACSSERVRPRAARSCASRTIRRRSWPTPRRARSTRSPSTAPGSSTRPRRAAASTRWRRARRRSSPRSPASTACSSLVLDKAGTGLFAGTGADGKVFHIEPSGSVERLLHDRRSVRRLARARARRRRLRRNERQGPALPHRGRRARHRGLRLPGRRRARDRPRSERDRVRHRERGAGERFERSGESSTPRRNASGRSPPGPATAPRSKPGKGSLWRFDARGRPERMMHHDEFHYVSLAVDERGMPYVGTGAEGRVYTVDDAHVVSLVADTDERQVGAIGIAARGRFVVGSDPAVVSPRAVDRRARRDVDEQAARRGPSRALRSPDLAGHRDPRGLDPLGRHARPGHDVERVAGPDPRGRPLAEPGRAIRSGARASARRERLDRRRDGRLRDREPSRRRDRRRSAREGRGSARDRRRGCRRAAASPRSTTASCTSRGRSTTPTATSSATACSSGARGRRAGSTRRSPDDVLTKPELEWDTASLPEGNYRLRVDASDEIANPPDDVTHHALESAPVRVDNTPPVFKTIAMNGRRLRAEVVDGIGPIARVEVAIDGRVEWRPLSPADGIFDTADETVDADLSHADSRRARSACGGRPRLRRGGKRGRSRSGIALAVLAPCRPRPDTGVRVRRVGEAAPRASWRDFWRFRGHSGHNSGRRHGS